MKHLKKYSLLLINIAFLIHSGIAQPNTNFSGLKNTDLEKVNCSVADIQKQVLEELIGMALPKFGAPPSKNEGVEAAIEKLSITEDRPDELKAEIYFTGFEGGTVNVTAVTDKGEQQKDVLAQTIGVTGSSGMLELDLKLIADLADTYYLQSPLIRIAYSSSTHSREKIFCFKLNKRWKILPKNESIVVTIKPEPYKTASSLTVYSQTLPLPVIKGIRATLIKPINVNPITVNPITIKPIKNESAVIAKPMSPIKPIVIGTAHAPQTSAAGPSAQPLSFYEEIYKDYDFTTPREISDIALDQIYPDENEASGIYYYKPAAYSLAWQPEQGFKLNMLYSSGSTAEDGQVSMSASLASNISSNEYDFVKKMLTVYLTSKSKKFTDLKLLYPNDPKVNLHDNLTAFNIPSEKFSVSVSPSVYEPIDVSWTLKKDDADFLITTLGQNKNVGGEMVYRINETTNTYAIPLNLMLADKSTFGRFELIPNQWRDTQWKNTTPFSVKLKNMHVVLMNKIDGKLIPCIYTWTLNNTLVLSRSNVKFDGTLVPKWIDDPAKIIRMWMEYEVVPCSECVQEIIDMISSGVSSGRQKSVQFHSMGMLKEYGVTFMKIRIRSKYLDPRGKSTMEKTITIDTDRKDYEAGPFYSWDDKDISFEYMVSFVSDDKTYDGMSWISTKDQQVYINKSSVQKSMETNVPPTK